MASSNPILENSSSIKICMLESAVIAGDADPKFVARTNLVLSIDGIYAHEVAPKVLSAKL